MNASLPESPHASPFGVTRKFVAAFSILLTAGAASSFAQIEGYGKDATGGAGQPVCTVTSSAATGSGTFDSCVNGGGNRTIQFAVSSALVGGIARVRSNTTIDGCANGRNGVTLSLPADIGRSVVVEGPASNIIIRCIRFEGSIGGKRPGFDEENDLLALDGADGTVSRVVIDRNTFIGSTDGALDITGSVTDVTVSNNLLYGTPLTQLIKYGTRQRISIHHNVYTAGGERNPQIKGDARDFDFVSNVIYNQTTSSDGLGNAYDPYGTLVWNAGSGSDSPGNVRANLRANFWGGANSGLEIYTEGGASAANVYLGDNVCAGGCPSSPKSTPNTVPAAYAVTVTAVNCIADLTLPGAGAPNRTATDTSVLNAVLAALPRGCSSNSFPLTVTKAGTGSGTVASTPAGINCGTDCTESYSTGTVVTLSQAAAAGSTFTGWSGACTGTGACVVTMTAARSVTATFNSTPQTLTVAKAGNGTGTVTSTPAGINCGTDCTENYGSGTVVTLSQAAVTGSTFAGWSGACTGTGACQVTMSAAQSVTATFNLATFTLSVTKAGAGGGTVTSTPAGVDCGSDCSQVYNFGTVVTLSQSAVAGSTFAGWSGACTGTGACQVTMSAARSVTATFNITPNFLTVTKAGTGTGTVTSSPAGINCGTDCSEPYTPGTVVTLTPTAAAGSTFAGWSGACTGTGACQVTMSAAQTVTATFNLVPNALTLTKAGTGTGTVTSNPAGIDCGADCSEVYTSGTVVTLSQTAAAGSTFAGWSGACTGTGACQVTMSVARAVTATFNLIPFPLTVTKAGTGTGTVTSLPAGINCGADCSEPYTPGTVVTLTPTATAGSTFAGWGGACSGTGACQVTMSAAQAVTATFNLLPNILTVVKAGTGAGTVTSSPAGISCGDDCSEIYPGNTVVTLSQTADVGSVFAGWSGACTGTGACQVTMNMAKTVTATFNLIPFTLTAAKAGTGTGTVTSTPAGINCGADCSESYNFGTVVTLSQSAGTGSAFAGWGGACTGTGACQVTMSAARSVTATFNLVPQTLTVTKSGTGEGTVTSTPAGISCGGDCSETYANGTIVTLSQTPTAGSVFAGWSGACSGTGACQVTMSAARAVTAVFNDGAALTISVSDATVVEGNSGSVNAAFAVNLSSTYTATVSVGYTVTALTAGAGDFTPSSGILQFPAGSTSQPLLVPVQGDTLSEGLETFQVNLVGTSHGSISDAQGVGTILDDDGPPAISIEDTSVTEGDTGYQVVLLRVSLSAPSSEPVNVTYSTGSVSAVAGRDFLAASGGLILFPAGTLTGELALWVKNDLAQEGDETFTVNLQWPNNAVIARGTATVTIRDNDEAPALSVADVQVTEGHTGVRDGVFGVALSTPAPTDVTVSWATVDLTARAGEDYLASAGTLTIKKGAKSGKVLVPVLGDTTDERNEAFLIVFSGMAGGRIIDGRAQGVIWDDDGEKDLYTPIASLPYVVTKGGRYRLVGSMGFSAATGAAITVSTSGVTIDLEGHTLAGTAGASTEAYGILTRNRSNVTVENGKIQGFLAGVYLAGPAPYSTPSKFTVRNLKVHGSTYTGIWLEGRGNVIEGCEVLGTGGTTALDPGAGAVGISSVGPAPKLKLNLVMDTVAGSGGSASGIAVDRGAGLLVTGNVVKNNSSAGATGLLVTRSTGAEVLQNGLEAFEYGIVFTHGSRGHCQGNVLAAVATPTMGVTCEP